MKIRKHSPWILSLLAGGALLAGACSSKSPTAPQQQAGQPAGSTPPSATWNITVRVTPQSLDLSETDARSDVVIVVRKASDNSVPPRGTTIVVTATLGTLTGLNFDAASSLGELVNGRLELTFIPGTVTGDATVQAQLENSSGRASISLFTPGEAGVPEALILSHVEPNVGDPAGGEEVTVFGSGIEGPVRVIFGGSVAQVESVRSDRIRVLTPRRDGVPVGELVSVAVNVQIRVGGETPDSDSLPNGFTYAHGGSVIEPQIFSVTPTTGPNEGGTDVKITGKGFELPVQVIFHPSGSSPAQGVEAALVSATFNEIHTVSPAARSFGDALRNNTVDITVINLNSGFSVTAGAAFRFGASVRITSIGPGEGLFTGGDLVTIFGQGFDEPVAVEMGQAAQQVISVTGSEIVARTVKIEPTSCSDVSGPTQVVNIETGDGATGPTFTYRVPDILFTGVSPTVDAETGGAMVTLFADNIFGPFKVTFGDNTASVSSYDPDAGTITVKAPPFSGTLDEEDCDENMDSQIGSRYVPTPVTIRIEDLSSKCDDSLANVFFYNPTDITCRGDVAPTPEPTPEPTPTP